jgi:protein TonB
LSAGAHIAAASLVAMLLALDSWHGKQTENIDFEVIERPAVAPAQLNLQDQSAPTPAPPATQKVFGASRKSLRNENANESNVDVKAGNTVATTPDNAKLNSDDADSLPIPTDEYLISKMPSIAAEMRIPYPPEAAQKKIEGKVVMELLIDASGKVREARLLSGPGGGLNEAALAAIQNFRFRPAEVEGQPVAVRIPFTYNFVLENR